MNKFRIFGFFAASLTAAWISAQAGAEPPPMTKPRLLFNGADFAGWTGHIDRKGRNADGKLRVGDIFQIDRSTGVIHVDGTDVYGFIRPIENYTNYKLHVEWRWLAASPKNNSGVLLRMTSGGTDGVHGMYYEVETATSAALVPGDLIIVGYDKKSVQSAPARISPWGDDMDGYNGFSWRGAMRKASVDAEKPAGQWNSYDITANGDHISIWLNGMLVNEASGVQVLAGGIGLQAAFAPVEFRNILIEPLEQ